MATKADSAAVINYGAVCVSYIEGRVDKTGKFSCLDGEWGLIYKNFTDTRDGKTYKYIQIGSQNWMAENLNYDTTSSYCYDGLFSNCAKYGRLYTWEVAKKACPTGWHLPSMEEWEELIVVVDGTIAQYTSTNTAGTKLKSTNGWKECGNGMDNFGFSAFPAGYIASDSYSYHDDEYEAHFWSSTNNKNAYEAYHMNLDYRYNYAELGYIDKRAGLSVRCLKN